MTLFDAIFLTMKYSVFMSAEKRMLVRFSASYVVECIHKSNWQKYLKIMEPKLKEITKKIILFKYLFSKQKSIIRKIKP